MRNRSNTKTYVFLSRMHVYRRKDERHSLTSPTRYMVSPLYSCIYVYIYILSIHLIHIHMCNICASRHIMCIQICVYIYIYTYICILHVNVYNIQMCCCFPMLEQVIPTHCCEHELTNPNLHLQPGGTEVEENGHVIIKSSAGSNHSWLVVSIQNGSKWMVYNGKSYANG